MWRQNKFISILLSFLHINNRNSLLSICLKRLLLQRYLSVLLFKSMDYGEGGAGTPLSRGAERVRGVVEGGRERLARYCAL